MGDGILNRLFEVDKDETTFFDAMNDACKVVIEQNHGSRLFGDIRARHVHCNTQISLFEGGRIIDTVASDSHDVSHALSSADNFQLVLWGCTCKDDFILPLHNRGVSNFLFELVLGGKERNSLFNRESIWSERSTGDETSANESQMEDGRQRALLYLQRYCPTLRQSSCQFGHRVSQWRCIRLR